MVFIIYREKDVRIQKSSYNSSATHLDHSLVIHGDTVVGVFGQLIQGHGCVILDCAVVGFEVVYQGGHDTSFTEGCHVAVPHTAVADGLGEVRTEFVISLWRREQDAIGPLWIVAVFTMQRTTSSARESWQSLKMFSSLVGFILHWVGKHQLKSTVKTVICTFTITAVFLNSKTLLFVSSGELYLLC